MDFEICHGLKMQSKNRKKNQASTGCFLYAMPFNPLIIYLTPKRKFRQLLQNHKPIKWQDQD